MEKIVLLSLGLLLGLFACDKEKEPIDPDFTFREILISVNPKGDNLASGSLLVRERADKSLQFDLALKDVDRNGSFPAAIYGGSYLSPSKEILYRLTPVDGKTGESSTIIKLDKDGEPINFDLFLVVDGHLRIFTDNREVRPIVLAGSNLGKNRNDPE